MEPGEKIWYRPGWGGTETIHPKDRELFGQELLGQTSASQTSVSSSRERYTIIHVWKVLHEVVPNGTGLQFAEHSRLGIRALVPRYNYLAQKSISGPYDSSFGVRGAQLWNSLPRAVRDSTSLLELKQSLGSYLTTIPDKPPVRGYRVEHSNSLIDWRNDPSVFREMGDSWIMFCFSSLCGWYIKTTDFSCLSVTSFFR